MNKIVIIKTTVSNKNVMKKIIDELLTRRLAACINTIENVSSNYLWKDKIINDKENILLIKTILKNKNLVYKVIKEFHNYEIPEILTLSTNHSQKKYLQWINQVVIKNHD